MPAPENKIEIEFNKMIAELGRVRRTKLVELLNMLKKFKNRNETENGILVSADGYEHLADWLNRDATRTDGGNLLQDLQTATELEALKTAIAKAVDHFTTHLGTENDTCLGTAERYTEVNNLLAGIIEENKANQDISALVQLEALSQAPSAPTPQPATPATGTVLTIDPTNLTPGGPASATGGQRDPRDSLLDEILGAQQPQAQPSETPSGSASSTLTGTGTTPHGSPPPTSEELKNKMKKFAEELYSKEFNDSRFKNAYPNLYNAVTHWKPDVIENIANYLVSKNPTNSETVKKEFNELLLNISKESVGPNKKYQSLKILLGEDNYNTLMNASQTDTTKLNLNQLIQEISENEVSRENAELTPLEAQLEKEKRKPFVQFIHQIKAASDTLSSLIYGDDRRRKTAYLKVKESLPPEATPEVITQKLQTILDELKKCVTAEELKNKVQENFGLDFKNYDQVEYKPDKILGEFKKSDKLRAEREKKRPASNSDQKSIAGDPEIDELQARFTSILNTNPDNTLANAICDALHQQCTKERRPELAKLFENNSHLRTDVIQTLTTEKSFQFDARLSDDQRRRAVLDKASGFLDAAKLAPNPEELYQQLRGLITNLENNISLSVDLYKKIVAENNQIASIRPPAPAVVPASAITPPPASAATAAAAPVKLDPEIEKVFKVAFEFSHPQLWKALQDNAAAVNARLDKYASSNTLAAKKLAQHVQQEVPPSEMRTFNFNEILERLGLASLDNTLKGQLETERQKAINIARWLEPLMAYARNATGAAISGLGCPDLADLLKKKQLAIADKLNALTVDERKEKTKAVVLATTHADLKKALAEVGLTNLKPDELTKILVENRDSAINKAAEGEKKGLGKLNSPKAIDEANKKWNKDHKEYYLDKLDSIEALSDHAAFARFSATHAGDTAKLDRLSDTAFMLLKQLNLLIAQMVKFNEWHQKNINQPKSPEAKSVSQKAIHNNERLIESYKLQIRKLDDALNNLAAARALNGKPDRLAFLGTNADVHTRGATAEANYQSAVTAIESYFTGGAPGASPLTAAGSIGTLSGYAASKTTASVTVTQARHIESVVNGKSANPTKVACVQVKLDHGGKEESRQDFYFKEDPMTGDPYAAMRGRQGVGPNRLPNDNAMKWAIEQVNNYQDFANINNKPLTITASTMPNEMIEALMIVCKARHLATPSVIGRNIICNLDAMVEKAVNKYQIGKKKETIGLRDQLAPDPEASTPRKGR